MSEHPTNRSLLDAQEMAIARTIQASFLPDALPQPPGWEIDARFQPAREVAGDFYDLFWLTNQRRIGLVVADICGKGVGAALFMALIRTLIRAFARQHYTLSWADALQDTGAPTSGAKRPPPPSIGIGALKNAVKLTNAYLLENHGETGMFATLFFGVLDPGSGVMAYINGGHCPPLVVRNGEVIARLEPTGPALGFLLDVEWTIDQVLLAPGDLFLAFTDGVTEARSLDGGFFGDERLEKLLVREEISVEEINGRITSEVSEFAAGREPADDITLVALKRREERS